MNREGRHITEEELKQIQEIQVDLLTGCTSVGTELFYSKIIMRMECTMFFHLL